MEQQNPSQPQPPSLSGAGDADGVLSRLVGQSVLVYTLLSPKADVSSTAIFHGSLRDIYPDSIVLEAEAGTRTVARSFLIYKQAIVAVEPAALLVSPDRLQPY
jgi:hypothetical protein